MVKSYLKYYVIHWYLVYLYYWRIKQIRIFGICLESNFKIGCLRFFI